MLLSLKKKRYASLPGGSDTGKAFIMTLKKVQTEKHPFLLL
jgi:hypothetical protein